MRVLIAHNTYQHRGGEDSVVESEMALLRDHGNDVHCYSRNNDDIAGMSSLALASQTLWSSSTGSNIKSLIDEIRPDVIHVHNTFPLISPSLYWAADRARIPVVQTLHNFRLLCLQAMFLREGKVCEDCLGKLPWRGVVRACYRNSAQQSAALGGMLALHRGLGTYRNRISRYIALSEFSRRKFIEGGLAANLIAVKPNFVDFPLPVTGDRSGFLFVGRLSGEKGIATLAQAAVQARTVAIRVAGEGQEAELIKNTSNITMLGSISNQSISQEMVRSEALVLPSICYENFPRAIVEAFACGLPVIASRMGAMAELVEEGKTGLLFTPGSSADLAKKLTWAQSNPEPMRQMGKRARHEYETKYTPERNYSQLMTIYAEAIAALADEK